MDVTPNYFPESLTELVKQGERLEREIEVLERDLALTNVVADCIKKDLDSRRMELESLKEQIKNGHL